MLQHKNLTVAYFSLSYLKKNKILSHFFKLLFFLMLFLSAYILFIYVCMYVCMAVLGLCFCARAFSSCGKRGPLFIAVRGPLTIVASLLVEHRLQTRRLSSCGSRAQLFRGMWESSQTRARTRVPCIGRWILNHCATREALFHIFMCNVTRECDSTVDHDLIAVAKDRG